MNEAAAVKQDRSPSIDAPSAAAAKQERERSTIDFPYNSLDDAVSVAKAVHKLGGNQCRLELLAAELGHETVNSGGFRQKVSSAHTFGLTTLSQGIVSLTALGNRIVDPEQEKTARAEAFLKVPLYIALYEEFKNGALPPSSGLEAKMVSLGVSAKQKDKARQVFYRSAKEAGFSAYGASRLVYPALGQSNGTQKPKDRIDEAPDEKEKASGSNGSGGGPRRHPFIEGLLETLPAAALGMPKVEWDLQGRQEWLQTAAGIFNLIYKGSGEDAGRSTVVVTVVPLPPSSAK